MIFQQKFPSSKLGLTCGSTSWAESRRSAHASSPSQEYEQENMVPTESCRDVAAATVALLLHNVPHFARGFGEKVVACLLYDRLREAVMCVLPHLALGPLLIPDLPANIGSPHLPHSSSPSSFRLFAPVGSLFVTSSFRGRRHTRSRSFPMNPLSPRDSSMRILPLLSTPTRNQVFPARRRVRRPPTPLPNARRRRAITPRGWSPSFTTTSPGGFLIFEIPFSVT